MKKFPRRDRNENVVNSSSKLTRGQKLSKNHIASSTPLTGRKVPLSKITENYISEIVMESTISKKKSGKERKLEESDSSYEPDEENANVPAELLKDLRAAKYDDNPTNKVEKKR